MRLFRPDAEVTLSHWRPSTYRPSPPTKRLQRCAWANDRSCIVRPLVRCTALRLLSAPVRTVRTLLVQAQRTAERSRIADALSPAQWASFA